MLRSVHNYLHRNSTDPLTIQSLAFSNRVELNHVASGSAALNILSDILLALPHNGLDANPCRYERTVNSTPFSSLMSVRCWPFFSRLTLTPNLRLHMKYCSDWYAFRLVYGIYGQIYPELAMTNDDADFEADIDFRDTKAGGRD